jgi:hypothetical protein
MSGIPECHQTTESHWCQRSVKGQHNCLHEANNGIECRGEEKRREAMEVRVKSKWCVVVCLAISVAHCNSVTSRVTYSLLSSDHHPRTDRMCHHRPITCEAGAGDEVSLLPASAGRWHFSWPLETYATRRHPSHQRDIEWGRMREAMEWNTRCTMPCLFSDHFN